MHADVFLFPLVWRMHVNAFLFLLAWRMLVTLSLFLFLLAWRMLLTLSVFPLLLVWRMLASAFLLIGRAFSVLYSFKMSYYLRFGVEFVCI
jgi:hypothetical protein